MTKFYLLLSRYLTVLFIFTAAVASAQNRTVSGKVTSAEDASSMPGVSISEKGTSNGVITDEDGNYSISVGPNAILVFSFVGTISQEVSVGSQTIVSVALASDTKLLSEVVVVGYGTQQKVEVTGSIASVKGKDIQNVSVSSFDAALQGRVVGAQVVQSSGIPGSAVRMRIRGQASISGNSEPLYIVDGVPITSGDFSKGMDRQMALMVMRLPISILMI